MAGARTRDVAGACVEHLRRELPRIQLRGEAVVGERATSAPK